MFLQFWNWINGNVGTEGIDKDVEALFNSGYGSALFSSVNAGMQPGPIKFNSGEWLAQIVYAAEKMSRKRHAASYAQCPGLLWHRISQLVYRGSLFIPPL